jgi:carboxyl-terminal processing protease
MWQVRKELENILISKRFTQYTLVLILAILLLTGGYTLGQSELAPIQLFGPASNSSAMAEKAFRPFWESWQLIHEEFVDQPLDDLRLAEGALHGMLATLDDPNTRYLPPQQEEAARKALSGNLQGIGAEISIKDGAIVIVAPFSGSPAELAGLRPGDILREANGQALTGLDPSEAAALVRGPAGTTVDLLIERDGELFNLAVERDEIRIPSVQSSIIEEDIVYIRLTRFGNNTAEELETSLKDLLTEQSAGLILDLRSNPGGSLTTAINVADQFLDAGPILTERFGNGDEKQYTADADGRAQKIPLAVLIDQGSASASEVLAGAIQDRERGAIIGDTSFGKGTVQTWMRLSNGGGLRITTARWLTPAGTWVHEAGIEPDLQIDQPEIIDEETIDSQLEAAIEYLRNQLLIDSDSSGAG